VYDNKNVLTLHRVKRLKPVKKPKETDWLEPKLYTGNLDDEDE
jgi:hypothetical protein